MANGGILRDRITPKFIEAYKKLWEYERPWLEGNLVDVGPISESLGVEEKTYKMQLEVVMKQLYADFLKEYPTYQVDFETFWRAYVFHPLGQKIFGSADSMSDRKKSRLLRIYFETKFRGIEEYCSTGSDL